MNISLNGSLVLIGAGKMGGAMLQGWLNAGVSPSQIIVLDPKPPQEVVELLQLSGVHFNSPAASITNAEVILVAVKPQVLDDVLSPLRGLATSNPLILSVVAGKTIATFERHFGAGSAVIRTIPNTPAAVGRGITAMFGNAHVSPAQLALAEQLLSSIGEVVQVAAESLIDAATAVSGSGPAYVFLLAECLAAAGEAVGLPKDIAIKLARATVAGSGELMRQSGIDAAVLRQNVTSPQRHHFCCATSVDGE